MTNETIKKKFDEIAEAMHSNDTSFFFTMDEGEQHWSCITNMDDDGVLATFESYCLEKGIVINNDLLFSEVNNIIKKAGVENENSIYKTLSSVQERVQEDIAKVYALIGDLNSLINLKTRYEESKKGCSCECGCSK